MLFEKAVDDSSEIIINQNELREYTITVNFKNKPQHILKGRYDKNGLPDNWEEFVESVFGFMTFYSVGEMLDPHIYNKRKRRFSEYIFCSVVFNAGYKSYYYITE